MYLKYGKVTLVLSALGACISREVTKQLGWLGRHLDKHLDNSKVRGHRERAPGRCAGLVGEGLVPGLLVCFLSPLKSSEGSVSLPSLKRNSSSA